MSAGRYRPRLVAVWVVFLALAATIIAVTLFDRNATHENGDDGRDPRLLVPVPLSQVGAIEIAHAGSIHRFERDAQGSWFYHGAHAKVDANHIHRPDPAMAQRIEYALQGFDRTRMERKLSTEEGVKRYGLAVPQMLILVYRPQELQPLLQVAVGDLAPDQFSRFVMVVGADSAVTIANYQIENLLSLIEAVKAADQEPLKPS